MIQNSNESFYEICFCKENPDLNGETCYSKCKNLFREQYEKYRVQRRIVSDVWNQVIANTG